MKKNHFKIATFLLPVSLLAIPLKSNIPGAYAYEPIYMENGYNQFFEQQTPSLYLQTNQNAESPITAHIHLSDAVINETFYDDQSGDYSIYVSHLSTKTLTLFIHLTGSNRLCSYSGMSPIVVDSLYGGAVYVLFTLEDDEKEMADISFCTNGNEAYTIDFLNGNNYDHGSYLYRSFLEYSETDAYRLEPEIVANENSEINYTIFNHNIHSMYERTISTERSCYNEKVITSCSQENCGRNILTDFINEEHHRWVRQETDEYPNDCSESITVYYICSECDKHKEEIEVGEHRMQRGNMPEIIDCTQQYEWVSTCEVCGYEASAIIEPKPQHEFARFVRYITEPTCSQPGEAIYGCINCTIESVLPIQATGQHDFRLTKTILQPTCSRPGKDLYTCSDCGITEERSTNPTPGLNHNWGEWEIESQATCYETGLKTRVCLDCQETEEVEIDKKDHKFILDTDQSIPATCVEGGLEIYQCADCEETKTKETEPNPNAHDWTDWITTREPTCSLEGLKIRTCENCDISEEQEIAKINHTLVFEKEDPKATCSTSGINHFVCNVCGERVTFEKEPTNDGHLWSEWVEVVKADCTNSGKLERTCTICGEKETEYTDQLGHNFETITSGTPTCVTPSETKVACTRCGISSPESVPSFEYNGNNHEGVLQLVIVEAATTEREGTGYTVWSCCGMLDQEVIIPILTPDSSKDVISNIIGVPEKNPDNPVGELTPVEEALETINKETLLTVAEEVNQTFETIANLTDISEEKRNEYINSVIAATEGAVIAGSKLDNVAEESSAIMENLPEDINIDIGKKLETFYQLQFDYILGNKADPTKSVPLSAYRANENKGGIDYTDNADLYKQVGDFIDNTVDHMTDAASLIRVCSNEKVSAAVNDYVEVISVRSFRSFDKQAADLEFAENAYNAILAHMQEQTIANLNKSFEEMSSQLSGRALTDLESKYNEQLTVCENIDEFKWIVIEVMREKFNSILNEKYSNGAITNEEYTAMLVGEADADLEAFETIYKEIFYCWALGKDAETYGYTNTYGISLQELTDATIRKTSLQPKNLNLHDGLTKEEIIIVSVLGGSAVVSVGALIIVNLLKKRREVVR